MTAALGDRSEEHLGGDPTLIRMLLLSHIIRECCIHLVNGSHAAISIIAASNSAMASQDTTKVPDPIATAPDPDEDDLDDLDGE